MLKRLGYVLTIAIFLFSGSYSSVFATGLSQEQRNAIGSGAYYFNVNEDVCGAGSNTSSSTSINSVTPGTGAPDGGTFPNLNPQAMAKAIDDWIVQQNPSSTLKGLGATMVASAKSANINPFILAAIPSIESSMGAPSDYNVKNGNNAYGRTATASQPNFQGNMLWYKWSSVKASVDSTAPENQGISGGGDMATYLSIQFKNELQTSDISALIMRYAPPSQNNTSQYITDLKAKISQLVLAAGGTPTTGTATEPTSSDGSTANGDTSCTCLAAGGVGVNSNTIVLDPGHSPETSDTDRDAVTGLYTKDYPNAEGPEMADAFSAASNIKTRLEAKGYKVEMTKNDVNDTINLAQRAQRANATKGALLVTLHSNTSGDSWAAYPDDRSVRIPGTSADANNRIDKKSGLVYPDIAAPSKKYAEIMAPVVSKVLGRDYGAKSFADQYGENGLQGNGKNYGNTPVQTILSSIPEIYSEVDRAVLPTDVFAIAMSQAIETAIPLDPSSAGSTDGCGAVLGNVVQTAINYAWEDGRTTTEQKPTYAEATQAAIAAGKYTGGIRIKGDDCGGFITRVMQNSGADPEYGGGGYTVTQENHMKAHPEKYKLITPSTTADLQPGDIAINADHTYMYVGKQPGFATVIASSSLEYGNVPPRAPTAGGETPADPSFRWYRLIN